MLNVGDKVIFIAYDPNFEDMYDEGPESKFFQIGEELSINDIYTQLKDKTIYYFENKDYGVYDWQVKPKYIRDFEQKMEDILTETSTK